jgi:hypothetical protein
MAAISARLANMGFMKRGKVSNARQDASQQPEQPAAAGQPTLRQAQGSSKHAVKQEAAAAQPDPSQRMAQAAADAAAAGEEPAVGTYQQQQQREPAERKYKLSDNIANMKFMQRAQLKRSRDEAFDNEQAAKDEAEWVSATAVQHSGCVILHERDPLPAGVGGRMSFGFGHLHDLAEAEEAERQAAEDAAAEQAHSRREESGRFGMGNAMRTKDAGTREAKRQRREGRRH